MLFLLLVSDLSWWQILLSWLLPFFLGWLLSKYLNSDKQENQSMPNQTFSLSQKQDDSKSNSDFRILQQKNIILENDLHDCGIKKLQQERKIFELENQLKEYKSIDRIEPAKIKPLEVEVTKTEVAKESIPEKLPIVTPQVSQVNYIVESDLTDYSIFDRLTNDKLQMIEGLGPKMESFLHGLNIRTWADLAQQNPIYIKSELEAIDPKYRILEPESWPIQAALARDRKWKELIEYQKQLSAGKSKDDKKITDSKIEKMVIKLGFLRKYEKDDLKAIEGIGPKIEEILHHSGIWTWSQLSIFDVRGLKSILERAGERYQLADPTTWPEQAKIANSGDWKALFEFQDTLKGGKKI